MKFKLFFLLVSFFALSGYAQDTKTISGVIVDPNEMPLPGAEVKVIDKNIFSITDFDGNFTLEGVEEGDVFRVTFLDFKPQEITISSQDQYNITQEEDA